ncbi:MAG: DUF4293 domain-containing protein [Ferruginibacter sp.]|nr:DUF4293 domain-containing protein [Ferruginibacter sp.]
MIQRIQSIWLLLATVFVFLTMQLTSYVGADAEGIAHFIKGTSSTVLVIATSVVGTVSLIAIFLFKQRKLQIKVVLFALLLEFVLAFLYYREIHLLVGKGEFAVTALLHLGVVLFLLLAAKSIMADEKLIKDSNRLR